MGTPAERPAAEGGGGWAMSPEECGCAAGRAPRHPARPPALPRRAPAVPLAEMVVEPSGLAAGQQERDHSLPARDLPARVVRPARGC